MRGFLRKERMGLMMTSVWVTVQRMGSRERRHVSKDVRRTRRRVSECDGSTIFIGLYVYIYIYMYIYIYIYIYIIYEYAYIYTQ